MQTPISQERYFAIRKYLEANLPQISNTEAKYMQVLVMAFHTVATQIAEDFSKAIELLPFWINYPPLQRGRAPTGQSIPWLEVGETVIGAHVIRALSTALPDIQYPGLPSGADIRFKTHEALVHLDIKITGPNDKPDEIVASPNQISGDGIRWEQGGIINSPVIVHGQRAQMVFQPELSPVYVLGEQILPCLTYFLKGVYAVESPGNQPLNYLELVCVPNGLMSFAGPNYNHTVQGLFIPGKDEKGHKKKRVRVRMEPLAALDSWRRQTVWERG